MEHPELIRTQENPVAPPRTFPYDDNYSSLEALTISMKELKDKIHMRIEMFLQNARNEKRKAGESAAMDSGLGFVDTE